MICVQQVPGGGAGGVCSVWSALVYAASGPLLQTIQSLCNHKESLVYTGAKLVPSQSWTSSLCPLSKICCVELSDLVTSGSHICFLQVTWPCWLHQVVHFLQARMSTRGWEWGASPDLLVFFFFFFTNKCIALCKWGSVLVPVYCCKDKTSASSEEVLSAALGWGAETFRWSLEYSYCSSTSKQDSWGFSGTWPGCILDTPQVFCISFTSWKPRGRPRTHWTDHVSWLTWKGFVVQ